jgi:hypothetical protein
VTIYVHLEQRGRLIQKKHRVLRNFFAHNSSLVSFYFFIENYQLISSYRQKKKENVVLVSDWSKRLSIDNCLFCLLNTYLFIRFLLFCKVRSMAKILQLLSFIVGLIRSFLSIWIHLGVRLIYGNQKFRLPPITNQLLLQPATVIAKRIRQRQVKNK